ncbi:uncharacterized protein PRCAT00001398001 [Priceomyces carsonii]|uniref:uncharacterized protein n=1 Tax=Priceomyces carsonii TaxID=28549 RepID=UPI002EDB863E|nr:unnamed protein product [Priceomyces carsonii]
MVSSVIKEKVFLAKVNEEIASYDDNNDEKSSLDLDKNLEFIKHFDSKANLEEVSDRVITKKLDKIFILPMTIVYTLQFLDKVSLNYAKVMGVTVELNFTGNQFSDLATYFFVAYIAAEFLQGFIIIPKFPVGLVLGVNVVIWGVTTMCCAAPTSFRGLLAVRILLGISEAAVVPCLTLITTNFYTKSEGSFRIGLWYSGLGFGQIIGGILSYLFQLVSPSAAVSGWRILFLVVGAANIVAGIYVCFFIPSSPLETKQLTPKEKYVLLMKLSSEKIGVGNNKVSILQIFELIRDVQAWLLLLISATISFSSNTISTFSATDIISFGFTSKEAALLNIPSGLVSVLSSWISTFLIMKGVPRYLAISVLLIPAVCGGALMSFLPKTNKAGLLIGIYMINTVTPPLAICYSWAGANFAGSTKKVGSTAVFICVGFALGNIVGPQSYRVEDSPNYYPAKISMLVTQAVSILLALIIAGIYYRRNRIRDKSLSNEASNENEELETVWADLTDFQNKSFRYSY